jgi:hypothetical protein
MIDGLGNTRHLVAVAGKDQNLYIADRSNMGKYNPANNNALYQELTNVFVDTNNDDPNNEGMTGGIWSIGAYFNGTVYYGPVRGYVLAFSFTNAVLGGASSSQSPTAYGYPGATPCISANGTSNGIVWTSELIASADYEGGGKAGTLHAYAATNLVIELYNSNQATNSRDAIGGQKFTPPTIASGRVYAATSNGVAVFGLLDTSTLTPIEQWRNTNFGNPSNVGAGANTNCPAGDGVPNLVKYALGINPFTAVNSNTLASASVEQSGGQNYLALTVNRAADPPDVSFVALVSTNLELWNSAASNTTTVTNTAVQLVIRNNMPVGHGTNAFLQLQFVPNP